MSDAPLHVTLAREAWEAGLIVTLLMPASYGDRLRVAIWTPDGDLWCAGDAESPAMIRAYIYHWAPHREALAERGGLRLVGPTHGHALPCGCLTNDTTKERK